MQPERISRTHVVPGNIMSVEFKLFDFMTLKQFLYLVVCAFVSYVLFSLPIAGLIKFLLIAIIMISGIVIAFVQFNGEPFEVYTTNFLLGIIQPQRRVWSKTPIKKTQTDTYDDYSSAPQKALRSIADNYVAEEEVIPIDYNKSVTDVDLQEQAFMKSIGTGNVNSDKFTPSSALPKADLSKLNFNFMMDTGASVADENNSPAVPLINLHDVQSVDKSVTIEGTQNPVHQIDLVQNVQSASPVNQYLNVKQSDMNPNNFNTGNVTTSKPAFVIDMDDDDKTTPAFVPLAKDVSQEQRTENMPEINLDLGNNGVVKSEDTQNLEPVSAEPVEQNAVIPDSLLEDLQKLNKESEEASHTDAISEVKGVEETNNVIPEPVNVNPVVNEPASEMPFPHFVEPLDTHVQEPTAQIESVSSTVPSANGDTSVQPAPAAVQPANDNAGKIHGKIISADLVSQPGLVVTMCDSDGKALEAVITNEHGEFVFNTQPKAFQLKVYPPKKYLFSPMDKLTKEIIIHEMSSEVKANSVTDVFKQSAESNSIDTLENASEMDTMDSKIPNTINGVVKDDKGHYLAGVLVSIKDSMGTTIRALATNPLGQFFSHSPLQNGKYIIVFEKDGYKFEPYEANLEGKLYNSKIYTGKVLNINEM